MTKKDYELIARVLREARCLSTATGRCYARELAQDFAIHLAEGSPRFDRERFLAACGVVDTKIHDDDEKLLGEIRADMNRVRR